MGVTDEQQTGRPVLLAVDDDVEALRRISEQLNLRYGTDYRVLCEKSPARAREQLGQMRAQDAQVALVLASQWMEGDTGADLLAYVKHVHPRAKRGLMVDWGAWEDQEHHRGDSERDGARPHRLLRAEAVGDRRTSSSTAPSPSSCTSGAASSAQRTAEVEVVGERWSPKVYELTTLLSRNGFPHVFHTRDSEEGLRILRECGCEHENVPVVRILRQEDPQGSSPRGAGRRPTASRRGSTATATSTSW